MSTLPSVELGVLGPLQVRQDGAPVAIPGAKPRAILTMLGLHGGSVVSADTLIELLWGDDPPRTADKALQTHISSLRRTLGEGIVLTEGVGWTLAGTEVDVSRYRLAARLGRDAAAAGDTSQAVARFEEALTLWRGIPELPYGQRGLSEKTRWIESHAALVEDRADALLATGRAAEVIGDLEAAVAEAPLRERRWSQLMLALYRAGRQGEALGAYQRARSLLADELGVDPGPELRRLEAAIVAQDPALDVTVAQQLPSVTRAVTFLLTDIEGSTAAWEADADAMAVALARHDELVEQVVTSRAGRLIKTRGEGDATFSVFERPSAAAAAAIELQDAISHEPWALREPMRIRVALHTGEVELRDGDYFGRAVNRAARLRSLAEGGQILCSGATAELVIDTLPDDVALTDLGMRQLRNLARPEHVFELRLQTALETGIGGPPPQASEAPIERPGLPAVLVGPGPFVGRGRELERLLSVWHTALAGAVRAVLIAGEPGVGKTRLAGEWSRHAYDDGALVLYGRCDEDLGAPYQPFAEALRSLVPCLGADRLRGLRGVEALLPLVPGLTDVMPDLAPPARADPDTERYALFDAVVALLEIASASAPVVLILDDLHWAAKPTLLLLRHLLRFGDRARMEIVGTYRSTDLDRSHPLAAMLADLHRDGTANRLSLSGLDEDDVTAYVAEAGYDDEELARALASVTGGNPFFLIEALRHVDESGGVWDQSTLPQGVREAVSRRLSRLPIETNKALAAAAVVGSRFAIELVERVVGTDLIDAFDEACQAGIIIEEPGGYYRFNHALVRQSLLAELASVRRMRLHQRIATTLETQPGADDELLAELAHHYFECAWAGNAAKAVFYCRRAADQAMARLAYEGAADLYDQALHALEEIDDELPDRDEQAAELLVARCEALLAAGDVASAAGAVSQLQGATVDSARLAAWATCFDGQLSMLIHPERLDEVEVALGVAAERLAGFDDAAGEATAHTVRATCLARLGRIGDCEIALDDALTAARRAREQRRVNAVLANAPLAALWGPNPVPRAGGRCLDVVRLLRITTDSPAVEATSTRCQAILEAFRGRAAAARRMIDSARRTVIELGLRHALSEVEQFAGIVELVADDAVAAEPHLRKAYKGFRRMGLDADTAETAALLGRACLALDRDVEADELCTESERLAGHALKASIAWRTLRAHLLARRGDHAEARRIAEAAVTLAERTDALVDHGDACLTLATVLNAAGDTAGARAAAERAVGLYERKGAAALAEMARLLLGTPISTTAPAPPEPPTVELDNACVRASKRAVAAIDREAWDEWEGLFAPDTFVESRRKIIGFTQSEVPSDEWLHQTRRLFETGALRINLVVIAVRGERLALARILTGTADMSPGAPQDEFLQLYGIDEQGRMALQVWFDVEDIEAAMAELDATHARFEEERSRTPLQNGATRVDDQCKALFASGRLDEIGALYADDIRVEDRRRGLRRESNGRAAAIENVRAIAALGANILMTPLALRGDRLCLRDVRFEAPDTRSDAFGIETLEITEIDTDGIVLATVVFDPNDFEAAIAELDARYLAGEAAAHAHAWSLIARAYSGFNRGEIPAATKDWVNVDHRHAAAMAPGEGVEYFRASWELAAELNVYIEAVHRLSDLGAVFTHVGKGTSREGFEAEWRTVDMMTVEGDLINRCELFDEADLDTAITRIDELHPHTRRLENAASRIYQCVHDLISARDWDAMAKTVADNFSIDDRRRVVNAGIRHGRDAAIADTRAVADVGFKLIMLDVIAIRGQRLALTLARAAGGDPKAIENDALNIVEIDADDRFAAVVVFDLDDFDAAIAELDARYLAGEGATHARTWSVIAGVFAAHNRREIAATTPDVVTIDHRRGAAFAPGEGIDYIRAGWDLDQNLNIHIETAHRVNDLGAVFTWVGHGTSHEGFTAEWRGITLMTVDGETLSRMEVFDEEDLDAALARFDQLTRPTPRLENAASQAYGRFRRYFAARDWAAMAELLAADTSVDDHRRVVNAEIRRGRDVEIANMQAFAEIGTKRSTATVIATRGERLVLCRTCISGEDQQPGAFNIEFLNLVEITADKRIAARSAFDLDELEAATAELDARYLAGEAAAHAHTWSVVTRAYAALNRRELPPTTPDWVNIDHRRGTSFASGDMPALLDAAWNLTSDLRNYVEAVHRLTDVGAVVTNASRETSHEGFDAEWRVITVVTVEGDKLNRCEVFDETDLDAAIARFEELHAPRRQLNNATSQLADRFVVHFTARDWDSMAEILAADISVEDRRRGINAGTQHGRDAATEGLRASVAAGFTHATSTVVATRGGRLGLARVRFSEQDHRREAFQVDVFHVIEANAAGETAAVVVFEIDDIDAAFEELEARYLAGEAAPYASVWERALDTLREVNRHQPGPMIEGLAYTDHRRVPFADGDFRRAIEELWPLVPDARYRVQAVHALDAHGVVASLMIEGTDARGSELQWARTLLFDPDEPRLEIYEESDVDTALARFEELRPTARRLENAASQVVQQFLANFAARNWHAMAELLVDDISTDDRRRVANAGIRRGRDADMANWRATADLWSTSVGSTVATRGERLALVRFVFTNEDHPAEAFSAAALAIVEINGDNRIAEIVVIEADDIDAAFAELDARYLAGEAAVCSRTWSVVASSYAAFNRHEVPAANWVTIDHRRGTPFEPSNMTPSIRTIWDLTPDLTIHIEEVHRLNTSGVVITHNGYGTSKEGFDAEWRAIDLLMVDGDQITRCEVFDEQDLDAALVRFEELLPQARRLENAASQATERYWNHFAARDWAALREVVVDDISSEDRRRVVNAGTRHGRDAEIAEMRAIADTGTARVTFSVTATRGQRLALCRFLLAGRDRRPEAFSSEMLGLVETNAEGQLAARVLFDLDGIDAALQELDTRYRAGEAAAHADMWSVIAGIPDQFNRREIPPTTPDPVYIDHRPLVSIKGVDLAASIRAMWDLTSDVNAYIEAVHRLSERGAVITEVLKMTSREGFDAELWLIMIYTVEGGLLSRVEVFDEADIDAALARFEELHPQTRRLENAASRAHERLRACAAANDWDAATKILADDIAIDDRRRVVNSGIQYGRDAAIADMRGAIDLGLTNISLTVTAIRGDRLELSRTCLWGHGRGEAFRIEFFSVVEINTDERIVARIAFDPDDIDAALEELEARYVAGEAADHAHTWSVIARECAVFNRHEFAATTPDPVYIDHRSLVSIPAGADLSASQRAVWDLTPDARTLIEAVHRLSELGAVVTQVVKGTSPEGFDAEWQLISVVTVEGDLISHFEVFGEEGLDAALARFEELHPQPRRLENAATQVAERYMAHFGAADWDAMAEILALDFSTEDRRRVVGAGVRHGRKAEIADMRAIADLGLGNLTSTVMATRGGRLVLSRARFSDRDHGSEALLTETLALLEINADERIAATVVFDLDDTDAAFEELDTRYRAGEAAAYSDTWSVIAGVPARFNRHELPATTPDPVYIDHRPLVSIERADLAASIRAVWDITSDASVYIEAVHRLSERGAVFTEALKMTSREGFDAEVWMIMLFIVEGGLINRVEVFDEAHLDAALARFEELHPSARRLENTATRAYERFLAHFRARVWSAVNEIQSDDVYIDDHRHVVNAGLWRGRDEVIANLQALDDAGAHITWTVIATRAERLALTRISSSNRDLPHGEFRSEMLSVIEIDTDERLTAHVVFDPEDFDAAFEELDARYLAGEAANHSHTWSVIVRILAAFNRQELRTADWVTIDHRPLTIDGIDSATTFRSTWDVTPNLHIHIEAVHRLGSFGAVVTYAAYGTSQEGFDAEWRMIMLLTVEGDTINRCEIFDDADLDAALARFEELHPQPRRLENAASRAQDRYFASYKAHDWTGIAEILTAGSLIENRTPVTSSGFWEGRDVVIANMRALADAVTNSTSAVVAIRGERLALTRNRFPNSDARYGEFVVEQLIIVEIDTDDRIAAQIVIDPDDMDAAIAELDARYLAGEAAAHSRTWSVITASYAAGNRHELPPTTPDVVNIDHRRLGMIAPGDLTAYLRDTFDNLSNLSSYAEAVHRLTDLGAVITHVGSGTSREGFDAEWRLIHVVTLDGDLINRSEMFDEADLGAALARFDELQKG